MVQLFFDRIFGRLLFRKAYHFVGGGCVIAALTMLEPAGFVAVLFGYVVAFKIFAGRISFAALGILLLFAVTNSRLTTLAAGLVLFVGDGMAAVVGAAYGKQKWGWNPNKSILGSVAFFVSACISVLILLSAVMPFSLSAFVLAVLASASGCVAKMLPFSLIRDRKPDDNLIVVMVSGLVFYQTCIVLGLGRLNGG